MNMQAAALAYRHARSCSSAVSEDFSHRGTITSRVPWGPGFSYRAGARTSSALPVFCPAFAPDRVIGPDHLLCAGAYGPLSWC